MVSHLSRISSVIINGGHHPLYGEIQEMANMFYAREAEELLDQREAEALAAFVHDQLDSEQFTPDFYDSD